MIKKNKTEIIFKQTHQKERLKKRQNNSEKPIHLPVPSDDYLLCIVQHYI